VIALATACDPTCSPVAESRRGGWRRLRLTRDGSHDRKCLPAGARRTTARRQEHYARRASRAIAMPRKGALAPTDADDRFDDSRHWRRTLASNGKHPPVTSTACCPADRSLGRGRRRQAILALLVGLRSADASSWLRPPKLLGDQRSRVRPGARGSLTFRSLSVRGRWTGDVAGAVAG